jgi:FixJ family two-component response regulator
MTQNKIIIIDDDHNIRNALQGWLCHKYDVQTFESAESFLIEIKNFKLVDLESCCILLDFHMQGMTGVELLYALNEQNFNIPIIFMSGNINQADIIDVWRGGAIDFILKPFTTRQLNETLSKVFDGIGKNIIPNAPSVEINTLGDTPISQREAQVLLLLGNGYRQYEVAEQLSISLRTVKMYRASLKNKLSLITLVDLSKYCDKHYTSLKVIASFNSNIKIDKLEF